MRSCTCLKGGEKDLEFSQKFEVLGVTLDVGEVLDHGRAAVDNAEKKKQKIVDQIAAFLRSGTLSSAEAEQPCGRLGVAALSCSRGSGQRQLGTSARRPIFMRDLDLSQSRSLRLLRTGTLVLTRRHHRGPEDSDFRGHRHGVSAGDLEEAAPCCRLHQKAPVGHKR